MIIENQSFVTNNDEQRDPLPSKASASLAYSEPSICSTRSGLGLRASFCPHNQNPINLRPQTLNPKP